MIDGLLNAMLRCRLAKTDSTTWEYVDAGSPQDLVYIAALTIVAHEQTARVGDVALIAAGDRIEVSRMAPAFLAPTGPDRGEPIDDGYVSRTGFEIDVSESGVRISRGRYGGPAFVGDAPMEQHQFSWDDLEDGVPVRLGPRVVLVLTRHDATVPRVANDLGLIGEAPAMHGLRRTILRVAQQDEPVLIRGESGTGKELIARAIHECSPRAGRPYLTINLGAVPETVAVSELFGHLAGAFTGAATDRDGMFARADGGTLFLDEVGEAPLAVQAAMLRVVEDGLIQKLGGSESHAVDVRIIAATDANLEENVRAGSFRKALFHRISTHDIRVVPLRRRRADIGRLLVEFLRQEPGPVEKMDWLPASIVVDMLEYEWPGNVRELRNVVKRLALVRDESAKEIHAAAAFPKPPRTVPKVTAPSGVKTGEITNEALVAAMDANDHNVGATARALGVTRTTLYRLIRKHPDLSTANDISDHELKARFHDAGGDITVLGRDLRVSKRGLQLRLRSLGLI